MLNRHKRFILLAYKLACDAKPNKDMKHSMCALVVRKNKIISVGYNQAKTHPASKTRSSWCHAEFNALVKHYPSELKGCDMFIARVRRSELPGLSKPCKHCQDIIAHYGIQKVYWTKTSLTSEIEIGTSC